SVGKDCKGRLIGLGVGVCSTLLKKAKHLLIQNEDLCHTNLELAGKVDALEKDLQKVKDTMIVLVTHLTSSSPDRIVETSRQAATVSELTSRTGQLPQESSELTNKAVEFLKLTFSLLDIDTLSCSNIVTYNTLIDGHGKLGRVEEADSIFGEMKNMGCDPDVGVKANVVTYTALVDGLCKDGKVEDGEKVFEMSKAGVDANQLIYTVLINGCLKTKRVEKVMHLLKEMNEKGIEFDLLLYETVVWGLCDQGKLEEAKVVISEMLECGVKANHIIFTTLVDAYFKAGKE
ncbi:hypothetical protein GIB67_041715, partial [Kingdonia uniflora]